ncbi:uncharacterized protein LOC110186959 [Drosophila serrata]|uniref:uncharacterized protein LOC110186959 n=1 Tax=Drosophila serrata TaxID=7274 RepID=UPI000A1D2E96|nr:uncharacterized protein LOC110186959 [Drosophila serrata]XP_020811960.1 uncharacterized protein LOC110186959 [Drosophila serrata]
MRGIRKCVHCGALNGNRAQLCRNIECPQRRNVLDAVQLVSLRPGSTVYSLRSNEKEQQPRNFVVIQEVTVSLQPDAAVVSSKALCYAESCYKGGVKATEDCVHVKTCRDLGPEFPKAQAYSVSREVLWNLNISQEQKQQLWQLYKYAEEQEHLPAVQRLNATTFVVKCERSESCPAARLHVTALANGSKRKPGASYACACRKLKIIVEPDNSLVMQDEICDHLLLVLAGILSSPHGKRLYGHFTSGLQSFWMPSQLETPLGDGAAEDLRLSLHMEDDDFDPQVDILVFGDQLDLPLPDLSDGAFNLDNMQAAATTSHSNSNQATSNALIHYANDSQLLSNCDVYAEPIELTDCNIELMDQFQPTDQIDLSSEDIELPLISEPYNILAAPPIFSEASPAVVTDQLPIELATIAMVKKAAPVKASEIVTEVKSRKQPPLPAKRALIVNKPDQTQVLDTPCLEASVQPALAYSAWLDHVVELLNESLEPQATPQAGITKRLVQQSFHVHKDTFSHFCKCFSAGIKRRPLDKVTVIESGRYKGLTKYTWHFTTSHTVKRIFSTGNIELQLVRAFERHPDGEHFVPYVRPPVSEGSGKKRLTYATLRLYMAKIIFEMAPKEQAGNGVLLTWTPDVLPRSHFGLMQVEFVVETQAPS